MTPPLKPEPYSPDNPFAIAGEAAPHYRADNPFALPDFSGVEGGATTDEPGLLERTGHAFQQLGSALYHHPIRTITRAALRPLEAAGEAIFSPVEGERAPVAAKIGYGPAVGLPQPGTIITRENTPVAITPEQQGQAQVETAANVLATLAFAPARAALTPTVGRTAAGTLSGAAGGAAAGAAATPNDRGVGAIVGGTVGGVIGGASSLHTPKPNVRPRPDYSDVPEGEFEVVRGDLPPGRPPALEAGRTGGVPVERQLANPAGARSAPATASPYRADNPFSAGQASTRPESVALRPTERPVAARAASPSTALVRREPIALVEGAPDRMTLADGSKYDVVYAWARVGDLVPSHRHDSYEPHPEYPAGVQGRRYEANKAAQLANRQKAQNLDPDQVTAPSGNASGTPAIVPGGLVLSGNDRTMALQGAHANHPEAWARYRAKADQDAARVGLGPAPSDDMALVRVVRNVDEGDVAAMQRFNAASDVPAEKAHSDLDEGAMRADRLAKAPAALQHLSDTLAPDQTVTQYLDTPAGRDFMADLVQGGVITTAELPRFQDVNTGKLTVGGKQLIRRMLQQAAVGDPDVLAGAPAGIVQQMDHALPSVVQVAGSPFALSRDLADALDLLGQVSAHREAGHQIGSVADLAAQGDLLGSGDRVARARLLAEFLEQHGKQATTDAFRRYATLAREAASHEAQGGDMFGAQPITPDEAFLDVFGPAATEHVAETSPAYTTRAAAERILNDPKEQFLAKHGRPSAAYLEARKYLGAGEALSAEDIRLNAAADRQAGIESRDHFEQGQAEMFGHESPAPAQRPTSPKGDGGQGTLLAEGETARYRPSDATEEANDATRRLGPDDAGQGLLVGRGSRGGDVYPVGQSGAAGGSGSGLQSAAGRGGEGEGGLPDPTEFADEVASRVAERDSRDPEQQQLFQQIHGAARSLATVARQAPAAPLFSGKIPGLHSEPYCRTLLAQLKREQRARPLTGQRVETVRDLAVAMQLYRDPRWETFRVVYVQQGRIVYVEALGARAGSGVGKQLNSAFAFLPGGEAVTFQHIKTTAQHAGADGIYLQHNHPSGRPNPSAEDRAVTRQYAQGLSAAKGPRLLGHLIIDDTEYGFLDEQGVPTAPRPLTASETRPLGFHRGRQVKDPTVLAEVARAAKASQRDPEATLLIYANAQPVVLSVQEVSLDQLLDPAFQPSVAGRHAAATRASKARDSVARWAQLAGAHYAFAITPSRAAGARVRAELGPILADVLVVPPMTGNATPSAYSHVAQGGMSVGSVTDYLAPNPLRTQLEQQFTRVREPEEGYQPGTTPDGEAAYQRRAAKIDFSGALAQAADKANTGLLSSRLQRLGDAIANDKGPIERLGTLAERADPDFRPTDNPKYLLSYAKESTATVARAINEGVPDALSRETVGPSYRDLFAPFGRNDAAIRRALTYAVEVRGVARGIDAYGGDEQAFADAQAVVAYLGRDSQNTAFVTRLEDYTNALGEYAVKSGLWTREQWEAMQASDALYIPYRRILDTSTGAKGPRGMVNVGSGVKSFLGSRRALSNPALALAEYTDAIIRRADAYRVGAALFNAAERLGDYGRLLLTPVESPDIPTRVKALDALRRQARAAWEGNPAQQAVLERLGDLFQAAPDPHHPVIWRHRPDGSKAYALVNAPDLYAAVSGLAAPPGQVQRFLDLTLLPARRVFTAATTAFVPRFAGGTNPARDIVDAFAKTQHGVTPLDMARGYVDALGEVVGADKLPHYLPALQRALAPLGVQLDQLPGLSAHAATAQRHGLSNVSMFGEVVRPAQVARRFAPTTTAQRIAGAVGRYTGGDRSPLMAVERVFSASDLGPRLAERAAAKRNAVVLDRLRRGVWDAADVEVYASTAGRVITLDFSNQPGNPIVRVFGRYVPFARPALQSPVRYAEAFARNPKRLFAFMAGISAAAVGAWVLKHRSQRALALTNDRTDEERAGFLLFPMDDNANVTLRLPLGQEAAVLAAGTTAILDAWMDSDPHAASVFATSVLRALPPGVDQWVQGHPEVPIPVLQQIQENDRNRRFFGDVPVESERLQGLAPEERRYETTPSTYTLVARLLGTSPLKARNLARGVLSQAEPLVTRGTDVLADKIMGESAPVVVRQPARSSPFNPLAAFVATNPPYRTRSEDAYYAARDRYAAARADARAALKAEDRSAVARMRARGDLDVLADTTRGQIFGAVDQALGELRDLQHEVEAAARQGASPAITRQRMDAITAKRQDVYRRALVLLHEPTARTTPAEPSAPTMQAAR